MTIKRLNLGGGGERTPQMRSDTQIEETDSRGGKVFDIVHWTVAADGKSIALVDTDPVHGTKTTFIAERQP
jgi:hypothetical protein